MRATSIAYLEAICVIIRGGDNRRSLGVALRLERQLHGDVCQLVRASLEGCAGVHDPELLEGISSGLANTDLKLIDK